MKLNRKYEQSEEFAERQAWLPFEAAVIVALEVAAHVKKTLGKWVKGFVKAMKYPTTKADGFMTSPQLLLKL